MNKFIKSIKKGFTLVELVVVIAIIAILAAVSVGGYFIYIGQAQSAELTTIK
ncbi:MAG: prepilin-type N-terminal cleavage/methylation domain-containing protein, partial [Bacilli bacterium]